IIISKFSVNCTHLHKSVKIGQRMSNVKRSLRARPGSDFGRCDVCRQTDAASQLLTCSYCTKQFHPITCLNLTQDTLEAIKQRLHAPGDERPFDSVGLSEDALHQCYDSSLWYCIACKLCYICKCRSRQTR